MAFQYNPLTGKLDFVNNRISGTVIFKGTITTSSDFPTTAVVQNGDSYFVNATVTDNNPSKTNTGQSFVSGDEIAWNGTDWTNLGNATSILATTNTWTGSNTFSNTVNFSGLTASRALVLDASKNITTSSVTTTELGYLSGVTSALQTQLDGKQATGNYITGLSGEATASGPGVASVTLSNSAVIAKVLTGFTSGSGALSATDSILQAIQKLDGNIGLRALASGYTANRVLISDGSGSLTTSTTSTTQVQYLSSATGTTGTTSSNIVFSASPVLTGVVSLDTLQASGSGGLLVKSNSGTDVALLGAGGGAGTTFYGGINGTSFNNVVITSPGTSATLTLTNGSSLITSGAFAITLTATATTNVTLPASGTLYSTATGSITSAQLASSLTDETGTGFVVFSDSPVFSTAVTLPYTTATSIIVGGSTFNLSGASQISQALGGTLSSTANTEVNVSSSGVLSANQTTLTTSAYRITSGSDWATTAMGISMNVDTTKRASYVGVSQALWFNPNGGITIGPTPYIGSHSNFTVVGSTSGYSTNTVFSSIVNTTSSSQLDFYVSNGSSGFFPLVAGINLNNLNAFNFTFSGVETMRVTTGKITVTNTNESTTLTDFTQSLTNAGLLISTEYTANAYTAGLFWATTNDSPTVPKAGIWMRETGAGTLVFIGTSNNYAAGVTSSISIDQNGSVSVQSIFANSIGTFGTNGGTTGSVVFNGSTSGAVTVSVSATAGTWTMKLPTSAGTSGQVLSTDGAGVTSWATVSSGTSYPEEIYAASSATLLFYSDVDTYTAEVISLSTLSLYYSGNQERFLSGVIQQISASTIWGSATRMTSAMIRGGYVYVYIDSGAAARIYRCLLTNDISASGNWTQLTISGTTLPVGQYNCLLGYGDGKFWISNYATNYIPYTLSGTTLTSGTAVTITSSSYRGDYTRVNDNGFYAAFGVGPYVRFASFAGTVDTTKQCSNSQRPAYVLSTSFYLQNPNATTIYSLIKL